jgi:broad specificity phosphatase PhoE
LIIVRHGRTAANAEGLLAGRIDVGLDDVGRAQATAAAAAVLAAHGAVDRVIASPLSRALDTAAAFGRPVEVDERWIELDYGDYDGTRMSAVPAEEWAAFRADPQHCLPGGESLGAVAERVAAAGAEILPAAKDQTIVIVSHVSPIKAAVAWALGVGPEISWRTNLQNASITRIAAGPRGPVLHGFNDVAHLVVAGRP